MGCKTLSPDETISKVKDKQKIHFKLQHKNKYFKNNENIKKKKTNTIKCPNIINRKNKIIYSLYT